MVKSPKPGEGFPLSVVRKETNVAENDQTTIQNAADAVKDTSNQAIQDIAEQLKALREQVQSLQATTADIAAKAGQVVASGAKVAGDKVAEGARAAGDKAVAGAKVAGEKVTTTVETYPISALLVASATAFLLGRLSASAYHQPSYTESTMDSLRHRLGDLSSRLPPHLKSALRSSLR